jgi:hypothetical protein
MLAMQTLLVGFGVGDPDSQVLRAGEMWLGRASGRFSLFLSALSLVLSCLTLIWQDRRMWYVIPFIALPACVLFALGLPRRQNEPVKGKRTLAERTALGMLALAVNPKQCPLCAKLHTIHADGTTVAALAARGMLFTIKELQIQLLHQLREMVKLEKAFSKDVVETHYTILHDIHSVILNTLSRGNILVTCYRNITGAKDVLVQIEEVNDRFEGEIIGPMSNFLKDASDVGAHVEREPWRTQVESLITRQLPVALSELIGVLHGAEEPAAKLLASLEDDWHSDLRCLWKDHLCKPLESDKLPSRPKSSLDSVVVYADEWRQRIEAELQTVKRH